ncbi:hypothetical protein M2152_000331 [Microbacteriaceae bacterium SG_E_30_P1]|uniref:Helicase XPB/Ssl2 N-terminal domain-containing protein n=1 Tax=Antiquaquibacter oligotrophicus TaxID=2880260 RepID=A0ABT6KJI0_9MICO|nr:helicase-associated domain-containing protein [Antiquaquibacter oligotrophicus]MDH6180149.1 hypothetical protein [Antiquaquibacter oligotrophicus]UDF14099.1 helicase-associated domain-containing protein [Antiquaquibacter oligotrophicus]
MPTVNDSAQLLAHQLRSSSDEALRELLAVREVRLTGIRDFFDLADALLDPSSVRAALSRLDRPTLSALSALAALGHATPAELSARLSSLGGSGERVPAALVTAESLALVVRSDDIVLAVAPVADEFREWPIRGLPGVEELAAGLRPPAVIPAMGAEAESVNVTAAEHAFDTTAAIAELVVAIGDEGAHELARGGLALPDSKRLASASFVPIDTIPRLVEIAARAGLIALDGSTWRAEPSSAEWLLLDSPRRWARLAGAWLEQVPPDLREALSALARAQWGEKLAQYIAWLFPASGEWMRERVAAYSTDAELLGITAREFPSAPGSALLVDGVDAACGEMARLFPSAVDRVYVQHDLTIVAPGPLAPAVSERLRSFASLEARALASTWRVSGESLDRAIARGETVPGIREFLGDISLTGIPQPLEYLLAETEARFGLVRVSRNDVGGTRVRSRDAAMLKTLLVDKSVASLGFVVDGVDLVSRFDRDVVFFSLRDARYPVAAEGPSGEIVVPSRPRRAPVVAEVPDTVGALLLRLRADDEMSDDTGEAWIARQLDMAIRSKQALAVSVRMPDSSVVDYLLEPASVAGGRLRGRDRRSDLERTLPLASIVAVAPAP